MGKNTKIEWADHTFNAWSGCARVSEGCHACYAEAFAKVNPSVLGVWGPQGTRPVVSEARWREPRRWDIEAGDAGLRKRVFCGSMMDIWEAREELEEPRSRVLRLGRECRHLDWLFLTKRPENIGACLSRCGLGGGDRRSWWDVQMESPARNWWFGCTVENRRRAEERIGILLSVPARVRFLSVEPLLESVDLSPWLATGGIHWVIVGGESHRSAKKARPFDLLWAEEIIGQCRLHKVSAFVKQAGSHTVEDGTLLRLRHGKGADEEEWPEWLRVRELPKS